MLFQKPVTPVSPWKKQQKKPGPGPFWILQGFQGQEKHKEPEELWPTGEAGETWALTVTWEQQDDIDGKTGEYAAVSFFKKLLET